MLCCGWFGEEGWFINVVMGELCVFVFVFDDDVGQIFNILKQLQEQLVGFEIIDLGKSDGEMESFEGLFDFVVLMLVEVVRIMEDNMQVLCMIV